MFPIGIKCPVESIPAALEAGYDYVEISLSELAVMPDEAFEALLMQAYPVYAASDMLPDGLNIVGQGVSSARLDAYLKAALARAQQIGAQLIVLDSPHARRVEMDADYPRSWRQLGNFLRKCQAHAGEHDLLIAVEPVRKGECDLLNLVSEATLITSLLQLENIVPMANLGHMAMASEPAVSIRRAMSRLSYIHMEGALDRSLKSAPDPVYGKAMRILRECGYPGGITLCGVWSDFAADAGAALAKARVLCDLE